MFYAAYLLKDAAVSESEEDYLTAANLYKEVLKED